MAVKINLNPRASQPDVDDAVPAWQKSRYGFAFFFLLSLMVLYSALRLLLFVQFKPDVSVSFVTLAGAFLHGMYRDFFVALFFTLPLLFWLLIMGERWSVTHWHHSLLNTGLFLFWFCQFFQLIAEYYFFDEFQSRFNTVAVDYLLYPREVFINIWDSYPVVAVLIACGSLSILWVAVAFRIFSHAWVKISPVRTRFQAFAGALILCVALAFTLSFKGVHFSQDRTLNEIADNGTLAFVAAAWTHNLDYSAFYKTMALDEAYRRTRRLLAEPGARFTEDGHSTRRHVNGNPDRPRFNVVILLEESLGRNFGAVSGAKAKH